MNPLTGILITLAAKPANKATPLIGRRIRFDV
jgi:hypothetical protein